LTDLTFPKLVGRARKGQRLFIWAVAIPEQRYSCAPAYHSPPDLGLRRTRMPRDLGRLGDSTGAVKDRDFRVSQVRESRKWRRVGEPESHTRKGTQGLANLSHHLMS